MFIKKVMFMKLGYCMHSSLHEYTITYISYFTIKFFIFDCAIIASVNILLHILWLIHEQISDEIVFCNNLTSNNVLLNSTEYRDLS